MSHVDDGALHAYLDGECSSAERAEIDTHLAACAVCRHRLDEERALAQRAGELLNRAAPPERAAPPLQSLRSRRSARRWVLPLTWAATVVLAVGLGYSLRQPVADGPVTVADRSEATTPAEPAESPAATAPAATTATAPPRAAQVAAASPSAARPESAPPRATDTVRVDAAAGVVAIREREQTLRAAAPREAANLPAPAAALGAAEDRAERSVVARRGRQVTTEWPVILRPSARELLGTEPVGVPGLAVRQLRTSPENDGTVLIEQAVDATTVIQLYQRRSDREGDQARLYGTTERLARFVDGLRVEIAGPLSQDSLNRLLEQLKPLP